MKTWAVVRLCFLLLLLATSFSPLGEQGLVWANSRNLLRHPDAAPLLNKRVLEEVRSAFQRGNERALALLEELKEKDPVNYQQRFADLVARNNVQIDTEYGEVSVTTVDGKFVIRVVHQATGGAYIFVRIPDLVTHAEVAMNEEDGQDLDRQAEHLAQQYPQQVLALDHAPSAEVKQIAKEIGQSPLGLQRSPHEKALQQSLLKETRPSLLDASQSLDPSTSVGLRLLLSRQHVDSNNLKGRHTVLITLTDVEISSGMASVDDVFKLVSEGENSGAANVTLTGTGADGTTSSAPKSNVKFYPNPRSSAQMPLYRQFALRIHDYWVATVVRPDMKDIQFGMISGITQFLVVTGIDLFHRMALGESFDLSALNYGPEIFTGIYGTVLGVYYQAYKTFLFRGYQSATKLFCKQWGSKLVFMFGMWALGYFDIAGGVIAALWHIFANSYITIYFKNYLNTYPNFKRDLRESTLTLREWLQKEERHPLLKWFEEYSPARHLLEIKVSNYLYQGFYFSYFIPKMADLKGGRGTVRALMVAGIPLLQYFASFMPLRLKLRQSVLEYLQHPEYSRPEQETKTQNIAILKKSLYDSANSWWSTKKFFVTWPVWANNLITTPFYKLLAAPLAKFLQHQDRQTENVPFEVKQFFDQQFVAHQLPPRFNLIYENRALDPVIHKALAYDLQIATLDPALKTILEDFWQNKSLDLFAQNQLWQSLAPAFKKKMAAPSWAAFKDKIQRRLKKGQRVAEIFQTSSADLAALEKATEIKPALGKTLLDILYLVSLPTDVYQEVKNLWTSGGAYNVGQTTSGITLLIQEVTKAHFARERVEQLGPAEIELLKQMVQEQHIPLAISEKGMAYLQKLKNQRLPFQEAGLPVDAVQHLMVEALKPVRLSTFKRLAAVFPDVEAYFQKMADRKEEMADDRFGVMKSFSKKLLAASTKLRATPRFAQFIQDFDQHVAKVCQVAPASCQETLGDANPLWKALAQAWAAGPSSPPAKDLTSLPASALVGTLSASPGMREQQILANLLAQPVCREPSSSACLELLKKKMPKFAATTEERLIFTKAKKVALKPSWWKKLAQGVRVPWRWNKKLKNVGSSYTMKNFDQMLTGDFAVAMTEYDRRVYQADQKHKALSPALLKWLRHQLATRELSPEEEAFMAAATEQGPQVLATTLPLSLKKVFLDAWLADAAQLEQVHHALEVIKETEVLRPAVREFFLDLQQDFARPSPAIAAVFNTVLQEGYLPASLPEELKEKLRIHLDNTYLAEEVREFLLKVQSGRYLSWQAVQAINKLAQQPVEAQTKIRKLFGEVEHELRPFKLIRAMTPAQEEVTMQHFARVKALAQASGQPTSKTQLRSWQAAWAEEQKWLEDNLGMTSTGLQNSSLAEQVRFITDALMMSPAEEDAIDRFMEFGKSVFSEQGGVLTSAQRRRVADFASPYISRLGQIKYLLLQRPPLPAYVEKEVHQVLEWIGETRPDLLPPASLQYAQAHYRPWRLSRPTPDTLTPELRKEMKALLDQNVKLPVARSLLSEVVSWDYDGEVHQAALRDLHLSYGQVLLLREVLASIEFSSFIQEVIYAEISEQLSTTGLADKLRMLQEKFEEGTRTVPQDPTMLDIFPIFNKRNFTRVELADLMKVAQSMIKIGMDQRESWNFYHIAEASTKRSRATGAATPQGEIGEVADFAQSTFDLPLELIYGLLSEAVINRHTQVVATNATKQAQTWQKEKKIYFAPTAISPNPCGSFLRRPQMI